MRLLARLASDVVLLGLFAVLVVIGVLLLIDTSLVAKVLLGVAIVGVVAWRGRGRRRGGGRWE